MSKREWFHVIFMTVLALAAIVFSMVVTKSWSSWFSGFSMGFLCFSAVSLWISGIRLHRMRRLLRLQRASDDAHWSTLTWGQANNRQQIQDRRTPVPPANLYTPDPKGN